MRGGYGFVGSEAKGADVCKSDFRGTLACPPWASIFASFTIISEYAHTKWMNNGFIYPQNDHGSIVYLTLAEYRTMQASTASLGGSILATFGFGIWLSREPRARKPISSDDRS